MSKTRFDKIGNDLGEAAANAAWIQWRALGGQTAARPPTAIVDPEALVLFSLWLVDHEPRVQDLLYGFAEHSSRLLSVQRLKRAMELFPPDATERVGVFAATVASFGKDPRWRKLAARSSTSAGRSDKVAPAAIRLGGSDALMLRLRTAFGVDVRTDTLTYLIGRRGAWADVKGISEALLYAKFSVRGACEALADARLIESRTERPAKYYADGKRWGSLLALRAPAQWHPWVRVYSFVLSLREWLRVEAATTNSDTLSASLAREFMLDRSQVLQQLQLGLPDERDFVGEAYLRAFDRTVSTLIDWLNTSA